MICKKHVAIFVLWHDEDDFFTKNIILFTFFKKTQKLFVGVVLGFIVKIFTKFNFCMFFLDLIGKKKKCKLGIFLIASAAQPLFLPELKKVLTNFKKIYCSSKKENYGFIKMKIKIGIMPLVMISYQFMW